MSAHFVAALLLCFVLSVILLPAQVELQRKWRELGTVIRQASEGVIAWIQAVWVGLFR